MEIIEENGVFEVVDSDYGCTFDTLIDAQNYVDTFDSLDPAVHNED